jgi:hypothetical protein
MLSSELIYSVRHSFIETRTAINKLDEKLYLITLINVTFEIYTVLTHIYILINYRQYEAIGKFAATLLFCFVVNWIKVIGHCLINGLVHDEADELLTCLDDISTSKLTKSAFEELLIFMSISRNSKFGFSIAGLMLFRKTALTKVRKLFPF